MEKHKDILGEKEKEFKFIERNTHTFDLQGKHTDACQLADRLFDDIQKNLRLTSKPILIVKDGTD